MAGGERVRMDASAHELESIDAERRSRLMGWWGHLSSMSGMVLGFVPRLIAGHPVDVQEFNIPQQTMGSANALDPEPLSWEPGPASKAELEDRKIAQAAAGFWDSRSSSVPQARS